MSNHYYVTSDNINKKENTYINQFIKAVKSAGHKATKGGVGPNKMQAYGIKSSSKGKIGVQIIGGLDGWTMADMVLGMNKGYYHYDSVIMIGSKEFTGNKYIGEFGKTWKMKRAHDAGSSLQNMYVGLTVNEFNKKHASKFKCILADKWQDALNEVGNGQTATNSQTTNILTGKEMIKDLIKVWDKEVEVVIENDTVRINKIDESKQELKVKEGVNIVSGSVNLSDYTNNSINTLICNYDGKRIILDNDYLLNRFGKISANVTAEKTTTKYTEDKKTHTKKNSIIKKTPIKNKKEANIFVYHEWQKNQRGNGHQLECKIPGDHRFKVGEWVQVYLPSLNEDNKMYIAKVNHDLSSGSDWETSLTLLDYPPQLSSNEETGSENNDE